MVYVHSVEFTGEAETWVAVSSLAHARREMRLAVTRGRLVRVAVSKPAVDKRRGISEASAQRSSRR